MSQFAKNPENERRLEALCGYLSKLPGDAQVSWVEIESSCGVKMDAEGRALARRAITQRMGQEYLPIRGSGVQLSGPRTALEIVRTKDAGILGAAKRAEKADRRVQQHQAELPEHDRNELDMRRSLRQVLTTPARSLKKIHGSQTAPMLPK